jgi:hypothetical protein
MSVALNTGEIWEIVIRRLPDLIAGPVAVNVRVRLAAEGF